MTSLSDFKATAIDGTETDLAAEFGPDWVFGHYHGDERHWLRAAYDSYTPKGEAEGGASDR